MAHARSSGFDRFNDALKSLDEQLQDLRERFDHQRHRVEREVRKRAEKSFGEIGTRADEARSQIYDVFGIASKAEVEKLHKRLNKISKQIHDLSEGRPVTDAHSEAV